MVSTGITSTGGDNRYLLSEQIADGQLGLCRRCQG